MYFITSGSLNYDVRHVDVNHLERPGDRAARYVFARVTPGRVAGMTPPHKSMRISSRPVDPMSSATAIQVLVRAHESQRQPSQLQFTRESRLSTTFVATLSVALDKLSRRTRANC